MAARSDFRKLQQLVDNEQVDELLGLVSLNEIADTWHQESSHEHPDDPDDDPYWWAIELWLSEAWWADEQRVRNGLLALVERARSALDLGCVGAGPLEVFVCDDPSRMHWIEKQAADSEQFREALSQTDVWNLPKDVFDRVERAARTPLPRPERWH